MPLIGCATDSEDRPVERRRASLLEPAAPAVAGDETPGRDAAPRGGLPPGFPEEPTLEDCTGFALLNSTRLRAAFEEWGAATQRSAQVGALPEPRLSYTEFVEEVQTRTGPQRRRFGLSQAFPWPGQLGTAAEGARLAAEARWERVEQVRLEVAREVSLAFHEYAYLGREERINAELLSLLESLEPGLQSRVRAGAEQRDLLRLQVEIGRLDDEAQRLERRRPALEARLAEAMSLDVRGARARLPIPALEEPEPRPLDALAVLATALERSPALRALALEVEAARAGEELAGFARRPSLGLALDYFDTGDAAAPVPGSGDDPWAVGLSLSLPVWTSSYAAAEREARHRLRAARLRVDTAEAALRTALEEQAFELDDAARRLALYRDSLLPRAAEALRLQVSAYTTGAATLLDLIDAERVLLEFERSFWRACKEYHQAAARLRALTGDAEPGPERSADERGGGER